MIKRNTFLLFLVLLSLPATAQVELNLGYIYSRPSAQMTQHFKAVHGMTLSGGYRLHKIPLLVGLELNLGGYGYQSERQTYTFTDGSTTETNVNVSNNVFNLIILSAHSDPKLAAITNFRVE